MDAHRICKTPTEKKQKNVVTPTGITKKIQTPRMSMGNVNANKSPNHKLFRARSSLGSISQHKPVQGKDK